MKYGKEIVLKSGDYKTVRLSVSEADGFGDCDVELLKEIESCAELAELNLDVLAVLFPQVYSKPEG